MSLFPLGLLSQNGGGGGAAGAFEQIETQILGANASSVTFSSIPSTYKHLQLRITARSSSTGNATALFLRFNGVSGTSYSTHTLYGTGSSVVSEGFASLDAFYRMPIPDDGLAACGFGSLVIDVLDYSLTNKNKTIRTLSGYNISNIANVSLVSGGFYSTNAISSLSLTPQAGQLKTGSRFSLYGIKG
jgi:hypothetical protein